MTSQLKSNKFLLSMIITYLLIGCSSSPKIGDPLSISVNDTEQDTMWNNLPGWQEDDMRGVWNAYQASCKILIRNIDWKNSCHALQMVDANSPQAIRSYFQKYFYPQHLIDVHGHHTGLITGYYEPILQGSRQRTGNYQTPLYRYPTGIKRGSVLPVRATLLRSSLLAGQELVYVNDPVEAAFLQIQGSGRIQLAEGGEMRVGFSGSNERPFQSIARWLLERREIMPAQATMQGIKAWAQANPKKCEALLNANPRFVFFRELPNNGNASAPGTLGVPLSPQRSLAVDPSYIPLGAPIFLSTTWPMSNHPLRRLMFAQDTGNAIKGKIRADFYWGIGSEAGNLAGRMRQQGQLWVLLPKKTL